MTSRWDDTGGNRVDVRENRGNGGTENKLLPRGSALMAGNTGKETVGTEELESMEMEGFVRNPVAVVMAVGENLTMVGEGEQATRGVKVGAGFCTTSARAM